MYITLETSYINFYSMINTRYFSYVCYICYVKECKFSTSTHENYRIVQNIVSAICGYFYSSQNPSGGSEMTLTVKKVLKRCKPTKIPPLFTFCRDIHRIYIVYTLSHQLYMRRKASLGGKKRRRPRILVIFSILEISERPGGFQEL